jgi:mRNA interferase RelE/StbE
MNYTVEIKPAAQRDIKKLPQALQIRITQRLKELETHPRRGARKLQRFENRYRVRVGDYRIIYEIHDNILRVVVVEVGHRGGIYRPKK